MGFSHTGQTKIPPVRVTTPFTRSFVGSAQTGNASISSGSSSDAYFVRQLLNPIEEDFFGTGIQYTVANAAVRLEMNSLVTNTALTIRASLYGETSSVRGRIASSAGIQVAAGSGPIVIEFDYLQTNQFRGDVISAAVEIFAADAEQTWSMDANVYGTLIVSDPIFSVRNSAIDVASAVHRAFGQTLEAISSNISHLGASLMRR